MTRDLGNCADNHWLFVSLSKKSYLSYCDRVYDKCNCGWSSTIELFVQVSLRRDSLVKQRRSAELINTMSGVCSSKWTCHLSVSAVQVACVAHDQCQTNFGFLQWSGRKANVGGLPIIAASTTLFLRRCLQQPRRPRRVDSSQADRQQSPVQKLLFYSSLLQLSSRCLFCW